MKTSLRLLLYYSQVPCVPFLMVVPFTLALTLHQCLWCPFISITYVVQFWITLIALPYPCLSDNGYFTCFVDLLVSDAPLHSDVVLGVGWLSIVHTATLDCCISLLDPKFSFQLPVDLNLFSIAEFLTLSLLLTHPSSFINGLSFILHLLSI